MAIVLEVSLTLNPGNQIAYLADDTGLVVGTEYVIRGTYLAPDTRFTFHGYLDITLTKQPIAVPSNDFVTPVSVNTPATAAVAPPPAKYVYSVKNQLNAAGLNADNASIAARVLKAGDTMSGALTITAGVAGNTPYVLNVGPGPTNIYSLQVGNITSNGSYTTTGSIAGNSLSIGPGAANLFSLQVGNVNSNGSYTTSGPIITTGGGYAINASNGGIHSSGAIVVDSGASTIGGSLAVSGAFSSGAANLNSLQVGNVTSNGSWTTTSSITANSLNISSVATFGDAVTLNVAGTALSVPNGNINVAGYAYCASVQAQRSDLISNFAGKMTVNGGGTAIDVPGGNVRAGASIIAGIYGQQPGGGLWSDSNSDRRTKRNIEDYTTGLDAVIRLNPVTYQHNGKGETADDGRVFTGLIANDVQEIMPEIVKTRMGKLDPDDEEETEILGLSATALIYALVNSVKELSARVKELEAR